MRAIQIDAPGSLRLVDLPEPSPGDADVVVQVAYCGICGSDLEVFTGHRPSDIVRYPVVPGHEWSGIVVAAGRAVDRALIGRKVVGENFRSCHSCERCNGGEPNLCTTRYDEMGFTRPGAWSRFLVLPVEQVHVLRDDADLRLAACLEPAACAADIVHRAALHGGERVAVVGAGTIGVLATQLLHETQPAELCVVEPNKRAAEVARRSGASSVVEPAATSSLSGRFDVVIETAGVASTAQLCLDLVRRGGRIVLAGIPASASLSVPELITRRIQIDTTFGAPRAAWDTVIEAFSKGRLDPGLLVTHEFDLAQAHEALALLKDRSPSVGKILLRVDDTDEST